MPTTGHGIFYPNSSAPPQVWVDMQTLATSVETALTTYETWTSFTPTLGFSGGFASVGAGVNQGFYQKLGTGSGALVHAEFRIELGAGFSLTAGTWAMALPVAAYAWGGAGIQSAIGSWIARDDSGPFHFAGTLGLWNAAGTAVSFGGSWLTDKPKSRVDSNDPIVWAAGDVLAGTMSYRAA